MFFCLSVNVAPEEEAVTDILCEPDVPDSLPEGFFDRSLKEINEYLGGHDEKKVTERVREYCKYMKEFSDDLMSMVDDALEEEEEGKNILASHR